MFDIRGSIATLFSDFSLQLARQRASAATARCRSGLTHDGIRAWMGSPQRESIVLQVVAAFTGVFLLVGLWTPVAGAIVALSEIWMVLTGTAHPQQHPPGDARCSPRISGTGLSVHPCPPVWQKASQYPSSRVLSGCRISWLFRGNLC
jgi:hypothetical protein